MIRLQHLGSGADRVASWHPLVLWGLAAALFGILSLMAMAGDSSTYDECTHLPSGYSYWIKRDFRLNPEHPPLVKLICAAPLLMMDVRWPSDGRAWQEGSHESQWEFGFKFLYHSGNDAARLLFIGRLPAVLIGMVLLGLIHAVSRQMYGPRAGLVSLTLAATCPIVLGHGHLVTTDVAAAAFIFAATWRYWEFLRAPSMPRALACGALLGAALVSKFSALALIPIGILLMIAASMARHRGILPPLTVRPGRCVLFAGLLLLTAMAIVWASYGFRFRASSDPAYDLPWDTLKAPPNLTRRAVDLARRARLLPDAYLFGVAYVEEHSREGHPAFALGGHSQKGWWWYFPFAFLVKTPATALLLFGAGLVSCFRRGRRGWLSDAHLLVPPAVLAAGAIASNINIGVRHLLPLYPFFMVLAGGALTSTPPTTAPDRRWNFAVAILLLGLADSLATAPYHLAYFNLPSRLLGPSHELLADSNLDWGQDLARLRRYMDREGIRRIKLAYFGTGSPRYYGIPHEVLPGFTLYTRFEPEWPGASPPQPGDVIAVSATAFSSMRGSRHPAFGSLRPIGHVGSSILVFRVP